MSEQQLGSILWAIADQLRGAMNADDFRDYMLSFLFLRYLSDNYTKPLPKKNMEKIEENDYNLNISPYISTTMSEEEIDNKFIFPPPASFQG